MHDSSELYAHWMSQASWAGGRIIMAQTTFHAERLHDLVVATFASEQDNRKLADLEAMKGRSQVSDEAWADTVSYAAQVRCSWNKREHNVVCTI